MGVLKLDILGSPHIGNYGIASNTYLVTLDELNEKKLEKMSNVLEVDVIGIRLINCRIIRPFFVGNSKGLIISKIVDDETIKRLKNLKNIRVEVLNTRYTAIGNLVSVNDRGGIASPIFSRSEISTIRDVLDIEIVQCPISGVSYVGSLLKVNNRGGIITPHAKDEEIEKITEILKVNIHRGTVNSGVHFISAGILVNDFGALVGELTDGVELMNINQAFGVG